MAVFPALLPVATSVTRLLLLGADFVSGSSFAGAAAVVGEAAASWDRLRALKGRDEEQKTLSRQIEARLRSQLEAMQPAIQARGISSNVLAGAVTEVEVLLEKVGTDPSTFVAAVRNPEEFKAALHLRGSAGRKNLEEKAEEFFDRLVDATADEIILLAPSSPKFQLGALQQLLDGQDRILEGQNLLLANDQKTHAKLDYIIATGQASAASQPGVPLRFGARPTVVEGFVERTQLTRLQESVVTHSAERTVLVGMRGCGKSQLAATLAQHCKEQGWQLVAWINAQSRESVLAGLSELGLTLGVPTGEDLTPEVLAQRCLNALASENASDRLVVLDNVEHLDDLRDMVPRGQGLRVLATTTRRFGWDEQRWTQIDIAEFTRSESVSYLISRTVQNDQSAADAIAERLGDLPLAISQAAASIKYEDWTLSEYLDRLDSTTLEHAVARLDGDYYPEGVAIALWMAIEGVLEGISAVSPTRAKIARDQLGALALLAASGVPTRWLSAVAGDAGEARRALAELRNSSICQVSADGTAITIHRLQGQVFRETRAEDQKKEMLAAAAATLTAIDFDTIPQNDTQERRREVLDRVTQLRAIADQKHSRDLLQYSSVGDLLSKSLWRASELGAPQEALSLTTAVNAIKHMLGPDHPITLNCLSTHAYAYQAAGRIEDAIHLFDLILKTTLRVLGSDNHRTLNDRDNLANAYTHAGNPKAAISLHERNLKDRQRVLGPDHPDTLASRGNLANAYAAAGKLAAAITLYERNFRDHQRLSGPEHPDTLTCRGNLAVAYWSAGRLNEASNLFERNLKDRQRVLGPDHPQTLTSRNNLANAYRSMGQHHKAVRLHEQNLKDCIRTLGPDHPDTLRSRGGLANTYRLTGQHHKAVRLHEQNLKDCIRTLGPDHPDTFASENDLAGTYCSLSRFEEATALFEKSFEARQRVLGPDHPDTLTSCDNLAYTYQATGRIAEATELFEQVLQDRLRILGPDHPQTLASRNNLADAYQEAGRLEEAIDLFEQVLQDSLHILGPDHPQTLASRHNLVGAYYQAGRLEDAAKLMVVGDSDPKAS